VENMARTVASADVGSGAPTLAAREEIPFLGTLPFDDSLEAATGDPGRLVLTPFAISLEQVLVRALGGNRESGT
jgi:hypothetical protein